MPTGAELFVEAIEQYGIREVFTLVGDHLNEVLLCAAARGLRIFDMRHEAAVVHAADAWARIHRRPSLSLVTGGPGHTNSLTGIATAFLAGSPVICVSGSRPAAQAQQNAFQDVDQVGMADSVVKWAAEPPGTAQIPYFVGRAWAEATAGRMGPVHLTIPVDLFSAETDKRVRYSGAASAAKPSVPVVDVHAVIETLRAAERPVIVAGSGIWWSGAEQLLKAFAEKTRIPVYTITLARGAYPDNELFSLGYADPALNRAAGSALAEADVVLVLGKRIDFRLGFGGPRVFSPTTRILQVDIHAPELGMNRKIDLGICADAKNALEQLLDSSGEIWPERPWLQRVRSLRQEWETSLSAEGDDSEPLYPATVYREIQSAMPADTLLSWDGGDFAHWGRAMLPALHPGGWMRLGPLATIGAALPNGLALQMAHPDKRVAVITGDGSLGFYIAELDTAVRHKLPIVVIVGNDAGWGLERELQGGKNTVGCELRRTRYDVIMKGFGGEGEDIHRLGDLAPALGRAFASRVPYLLNVNIRGVRSPFTSWKIGR